MPEPEKLIIKIRNVNANKGEAAKLVAGYYNISLTHSTIAFGNDINDIEMMNKVGIGVAVSNSANNLKAYVHDITEFDSHSGGGQRWQSVFATTRAAGADRQISNANVETNSGTFK